MSENGFRSHKTILLIHYYHHDVFKGYGAYTGYPLKVSGALDHTRQAERHLQYILPAQHRVQEPKALNILYIHSRKKSVFQTECVVDLLILKKYNQLVCLQLWNVLNVSTMKDFSHTRRAPAAGRHN